LPVHYRLRVPSRGGADSGAEHGYLRSVPVALTPHLVHLAPQQPQLSDEFAIVVGWS
jgi:hypothetical protein